MRQRVLLARSTEDLFFFLISSQMVLRYSLRESRWLSSMGILTLSLEVSSSCLLQNYARQGCVMISSIDRRLSGSNSSILHIKSMQSSLAQGTNSFLLHFLSLVRSLNTSCPAVSLRLLISCSVGGPVHMMTFSSWLRVEVPAKRGFPRCISASMQPMDQMSMALVYLREPTRIQGARYQRVAMYSVSMSWVSSASSSSDRTSPKSQSLASQFSLTSTLEGLTSRWMRPAEWRQNRDLAIWQKMNLRWRSASMSSRMRVQRSMSMCSKTRQMSRLFSALMTSSSLMTLGWLSSIRNIISRQVRCASVELLKASKFFLRAFTLRLRLSVTFQTCPQAPLPIFFVIQNRARMCVSMSSLINIIYKVQLFYCNSINSWLISGYLAHWVEDLEVFRNKWRSLGWNIRCKINYIY